MQAGNARTIVVTGATGLTGGAVAAHLLRDGWRVRALTRNPKSKRAAALAAAGAEVVRADMSNAGSLHRAFAGAYGVYSVQNPIPAGTDAEIQQGRNVANVAKDVGMQHVVYGSAGFGVVGTGVPAWESKLVVEAHLKRLGVPLTILRPMAFMELMTEKKFYPAVSTWHVMPALVGDTRALPWLCVADLGAIAAQAFAQPERYIGRDFNLTSDARSLGECRTIYRDVMAKAPPRFPLPPSLFQRMGAMGRDLCIMWRWLRDGHIERDPGPTRALLPHARTVEAFLTMQAAARTR